MRHASLQQLTMFGSLQGFLRAWRDSGLCDQVVHRINELVTALKGNGDDVRVLITGAQ